MLLASAKPVILLFVGHYVPGFKAGGILRSVVNLVNHLHGEFEFMIVTRDRDLKDDRPYPNISQREWQWVGNARVYYLSPADESFEKIRRIVQETPHDLIYLNSFFEPLTIWVLLNRKFGRIRDVPIILSPRGEFAWASLRLKYPKKAVFMAVARIIHLYQRITWAASSSFEADEIVQVMRVQRGAIHIAFDMPVVASESPGIAAPLSVAAAPNALRIVFLSRISPEKNLDFALEVLVSARTPIAFDVIGPIDNVAYWKKCERLLQKMPDHVTARYVGTVDPADVMATLSRYDLLFLPSGGENYGHVIAESLTCGTPVLTSDHTPWRNLEERRLGWDLPLDNPEAFGRVIETIASESEEDRFERRTKIKETVRPILNDPLVLDANRQLFNLALAPEKRR